MKYQLHLILAQFARFGARSPQFGPESQNWWQIWRRKYLKKKRSKVSTIKSGRNLTWRSVADPTLTKTSVTPDLINPIFMSHEPITVYRAGHLYRTNQRSLWRHRLHHSNNHHNKMRRRVIRRRVLSGLNYRATTVHTKATWGNVSGD